MSYKTYNNANAFSINENITLMIYLLTTSMLVIVWTLNNARIKLVNDINCNENVLVRASLIDVSHAQTLTWTIELIKQEVEVIWQKAPHGGPIPLLGVTPGGRKLYHWIPGVGFPISVP